MWLRPSPQSVAGYSTSSFCFPRRAPLVFADRTLTVGNSSPLTDGALAIWDCPVQHHACALSILRCGRRRRRKQGSSRPSLAAVEAPPLEHVPRSLPTSFLWIGRRKDF